MITSDEIDIFYYGRISNEHKIYTLDLFDAIVEEISALHQKFLLGDDSLYERLFELEALLGRIADTLIDFHREIQDRLLYGLTENMRLVESMRAKLDTPRREIGYPNAYSILYSDIEGTFYQNGRWDGDDWLDFRDDLKLALKGKPSTGLADRIANYDFYLLEDLRDSTELLYTTIISNLENLDVYEKRSYSFRYTQESLMINSVPIRILGANLMFGENERLFRRFAQAAQYFIDRTAELFPILLDHQRPIELPVNEIVDSCSARALACYLSYPFSIDYLEDETQKILATHYIKRGKTIPKNESPKL